MLSRLGLFVVCLWTLLPRLGVAADGESKVTEHLGRTLVESVLLTDQNGLTAPLSTILSPHRPTILTFVYYRCPGACTLLLNGLSAAITETEYVLGSDYDVVTISVDPMESSDLATGKRNTYVEPLAAQGISPQGWRFYTATKSVIQTLTAQTGFEYYYDADILQYIHPSVLIFTSPDHVVARYLYGSYFQPDNFDHALVESGEGTVGSLRQQIITAFHDFGRPEVGRRYALNKAKVAGFILGLIILGLALVWTGFRLRAQSTSA